MFTFCKLGGLIWRCSLTVHSLLHQDKQRFLSPNSWAHPRPPAKNAKLCLAWQRWLCGNTDSFGKYSHQSPRTNSLECRNISQKKTWACKCRQCIRVTKKLHLLIPAIIHHRHKLGRSTWHQDNYGTKTTSRQRTQTFSPKLKSSIKTF